MIGKEKGRNKIFFGNIQMYVSLEKRILILLFFCHGKLPKMKAK